MVFLDTVGYNVNLTNYVSAKNLVQSRNDNWLIHLQVRKARRHQFKIPDEELEDLKMDMEDVNCELDQCKNYLNEAENVLSMLKSDINSECMKFGIIFAGVVSAAAGTIAIGGGKLIIL